MNFTTTNMFVPRIWGFDRGDAEMRLARQSGWTRADLIWERLMEAANTAIIDGNGPQATWYLRLSDGLAGLRFAKGDPRRATAAAGRALMLYRARKPARAIKLQKRAIDEFRCAADFIHGMQISPRARSSLFHLRMEALHRNTYHDNLRIRLGRIADETRESLALLTSPTSSGHRHYARWRGEKPSVFDDTRKILAACLLIPDGV